MTEQQMWQTIRRQNDLDFAIWMIAYTADLGRMGFSPADIDAFVAFHSGKLIWVMRHPYEQAKIDKEHFDKMGEELAKL